jgi:transcriptional regulator with XRE-family HTH domain
VVQNYSINILDDFLSSNLIIIVLTQTINQQMNINQKIKRQRELKKISQDATMAYKLGISQSQYCRRENGTLRFTIDETIKTAKILDLPITTLIETNKDCDKKIEVLKTDKPKLSDQLINQYEARLKEKNEIISLLKEKVNSLKVEGGG